MNLDTILETLKKHIADNPQLTKAAVAKEIGVTRVELSQWLNGGERRPIADKAFQILQFLTSIHVGTEIIWSLHKPYSSEIIGLQGSPWFPSINVRLPSCAVDVICEHGISPCEGQSVSGWFLPT